MMSLRTTVHRGSHADARTPTRRSTRRSTRRGMLLPLVLVTMLLVFTIAASLNQVAWRATKGAQALWDAQRAMYAADAEVVRAIAYWSPDSVAATPIGTPLVRDTNLLGGFQARTTTMRTGPLRAVIMSVARRDRPSGPTDVDPSRVKRLVARAVPLIPPEFPLVGAATVLGPIALGSTALDGRDVPGPYNATRDDCGPQRRAQ